MFRMGRLKRIVRSALAVCCCGLFLASTCLAGVEDSRFDLTPDGANVDFDLRDVSRREVIDRLFADRDIKLQWLDRGIAEELVSGRFQGAPQSVLRHLLARVNFVIAFQQENGQVRITRVIILGPGSEQASPNLAILEAAFQPRESRTASELVSKAAPEIARILLPVPANATSPIPQPVPGPELSALRIPIPSDAALPSVAPVQRSNAPEFSSGPSKGPAK